jgi:hypothetical protein
MALFGFSCNNESKEKDNKILKILFTVTLVIYSILAFCADIYPSENAGAGNNVPPSINETVEKEKKYSLSLEIDLLDGLTFTIERRFKLFKSSNILFKDNHIAFGAVSNIMQSGFSTGGYMRFSPIAIFDVTADARFVYEWFGLPFSSPFENINGSVIENKIGDGEYKSAKGVMLRIIPNIRFKFGPVLLMYTFILYYLDLDHSKIYFNHYYGHIQKDGFDYIHSMGLGFFLKENIILGFLQSINHADDAGYNEYTVSTMFIVNNIKFISKEDMFKLTVHWVYKSRNKITGFLTRTKGLNISASYQINFNW